MWNTGCSKTNLAWWLVALCYSNGALGSNPTLCLWFEYIYHVCIAFLSTTLVSNAIPTFF